MVFFLLLLTVAMIVGLIINNLNPSFAVALIVGCLILFVSFLSTELALYVLIFSMLLSPEIAVSAQSQRELSIRMDDLLIMVISLGWLARSAFYKDLGLLVKTPLNKAILCYAVICILATLLGMGFGKVRPLQGTMFVLKYLEYFVIFFLVLNNIHSREQLKRYFLALIITAAIVALYAIVQIPTGERISAPFEGKTGEPNTFGGYLVLIMSLLTGIFLSYKRKKVKVASLAALGLLAIPFMYTLSRSSWMAIAGMYATLLIFSNRKLVLAVLLVIAVLAGPMIMPKEMEERYERTFMSKPLESKEQVKVGGVYLDLSASERINSYLRIIDDIKSRPLLGYGITGYGFIDGQYFRTLIETGLIGFSAFLYLLFKIFSTILRTYRNTRDELFKGISLGMLVGFAALLVHALTANTFIIIRIMEPFWFVMAMAVAVQSLKLETIQTTAGETVRCES
jgi:O-antigen ligase